MRRFIACLLAALLWPAISAGASPLKQKTKRAAAKASARTKAEDIRDLLELTGAIRRELASVDTLFEGFKRNAPHVPDKVWAELEEEFRQEFNAEALFKIYVPIYERHFSHPDIRRLRSFFASAVGRKLATEMPLIEMELTVKGMERGMELGEKIKEKLRARGFDIPVT